MFYSSVYLALFALSYSLFTLCIKWCQVRGRGDVIAVGSINYIVAALFMAMWFLIDGRQTGDVPAMIAGGSMGIVYFFAFFLISWCVREVGASVTSVISVLSMLIPIVFAAIAWDSRPSLVESVGVGLALVSLILITVKPKSESKKETANTKVQSKKSIKYLAILIPAGFFILSGLARIAQEAFKHVSPATEKPTFLFAGFVMSAIPSAIFLLARRRRLLRQEIGAGIVMGVANGCQVWFTLKALQEMPGFIFFPVSSAATILLTMAVAVWYFHEKLSRLTFVGIGLAVVALVMMNLKFG